MAEKLAQAGYPEHERGRQAHGAVARTRKCSTSRSRSSTVSWSSTSRESASPRVAELPLSAATGGAPRRVHPRLRPSRDRDERRRGPSCALRGRCPTTRRSCTATTSRTAFIRSGRARTGRRRARTGILLRLGRRRRHARGLLLRQRGAGRARAGRRPSPAGAHRESLDRDLRAGQPAAAGRAVAAGAPRAPRARADSRAPRRCRTRSRPRPPAGAGCGSSCGAAAARRRHPGASARRGSELLVRPNRAARAGEAATPPQGPGALRAATTCCSGAARRRRGFAEAGPARSSRPRAGARAAPPRRTRRARWWR